jgi:hypothetical protein
MFKMLYIIVLITINTKKTILLKQNLHPNPKVISI